MLSTFLEKVIEKLKKQNNLAFLFLIRNLFLTLQPNYSKFREDCRLYIIVHNYIPYIIKVYALRREK